MCARFAKLKQKIINLCLRCCCCCWIVTTLYRTGYVVFEKCLKNTHHAGGRDLGIVFRAAANKEAIGMPMGLPGFCLYVCSIQISHATSTYDDWREVTRTDTPSFFFVITSLVLLLRITTTSFYGDPADDCNNGVKHRSSQHRGRVWISPQWLCFQQQSSVTIQQPGNDKNSIFCRAKYVA